MKYAAIEFKDIATLNRIFKKLCPYDEVINVDLPRAVAIIKFAQANGEEELKSLDEFTPTPYSQRERDRFEFEITRTGELWLR